MSRQLRAGFTVLGLFSVRRFFVFVVRSDSPDAALGLNGTQWTSLALIVVALTGLVLTGRLGDGRLPPREVSFGPGSGSLPG